MVASIKLTDENMKKIQKVITKYRPIKSDGPIPEILKDLSKIKFTDDKDDGDDKISHNKK